MTERMTENERPASRGTGDVTPAEEERAKQIHDNGGTAADFGWYCGLLAFTEGRKDMHVDCPPMEEFWDAYAEWSEMHNQVQNCFLGHGYLDTRPDMTKPGWYRVRTFVETYPES